MSNIQSNPPQSGGSCGGGDTPLTGDSSGSTATIEMRKRSKAGCVTCRKRRIKCDDGRPNCANCIESKCSCEGYNQRVVFKPPIGDWLDHRGVASTIQYRQSMLPSSLSQQYRGGLSTGQAKAQFGNEANTAEKVSKLQLPPGYVDYNNRIEPWRKDASPITEECEGTLQHLFSSSLDGLIVMMECSTCNNREINSLRRCHGTLQLWAHQYGVHIGALDAKLQRSTDIRQTILELLVPLCKAIL
jgi:hypothetical protein